MATVTRTIAVNAAFLQEIKQDSVDLRQLLEETANLLAARGRQRLHAKRIAEALGQLRDQLALHFTLEEAYGYFEDALEVAPRLSEEADRLRSQHASLFVEICEIEELAEQLLYHEAAPRIMRTVATQFRRFQTALSEHEAHENDLILRAFDEDIGVGD